ncbi:uncharacterized protein LTR77_002525 [Saxophila tyrrhenica]|uniref:Uncharacterized protein n=1 Tax=Saxophila tyrrhenica TaxID=1690608 RepID=A0AAV9PJS3_9PEZI|nr:hypothetical protein LTR77_002525 [Saxophila tyrrhenica]
MGLFQTLLLAASLGWSVVTAEGSSNITSEAVTTSYNNDLATPDPSSYPSVTIITKSSLILYSQITTPHGHQPSRLFHLSHHGPEESRPPQPPHYSGSLPNPLSRPTTHPSSSPEPPSAIASSGGLLLDPHPRPTAIKTYIIANTPVAPGHPTEIRGTTYSVAASGTALYADGRPVEASGAVVGDGLPSGTGTMTEGVGAGASSSSSMGASTGGAVRGGVEGGTEGVVVWAVGVVVGMGML